MTKVKSFISWFPKFFEKATHEENLKQISESLSDTLVNSKMKGEFLTPEDINFVLSELKQYLKLRMESQLITEKLSLKRTYEIAQEKKEKIKEVQNLIKLLS